MHVRIIRSTTQCFLHVSRNSKRLLMSLQTTYDLVPVCPGLHHQALRRSPASAAVTFLGVGSFKLNTAHSLTGHF